MYKRQKQSGEKIEINKLKEIAIEAIAAYQSTYNKKLEHIVFHRDGINREDIDLQMCIRDRYRIILNYRRKKTSG